MHLRYSACKDIRVEGRPFIVKNSSRSTISVIKNQGSKDVTNKWELEIGNINLRNKSYNLDVGDQFLKQAEGEHASVASFARHTLQLLTMGAPAELLTASQKASIDEIKHAKMCYGLAGNFLRSRVEAGVLDVEESLEFSTHKDIIQSVITEGCIGETLSAIQMKVGSQSAKQSVVKQILEEIAIDESKHAQLAWNTIQWAIERYPELQSFIKDIFSNILEKGLEQEALDYDEPREFVSECDQEDKNRFLRHHGILNGKAKTQVEKVGIQDIVEPILKQKFLYVDKISENIMKLTLDDV